MKKSIRSFLCFALIVGAALNAAPFAYGLVVDTDGGLQVDNMQAYDNLTINSPGTASGGADGSL